MGKIIGPACLLLCSALFSCHVVLVQSYTGQASREMAHAHEALDGVASCSECSGSNVDTLDSSPSFEASKIGKIDVETGIALDGLQPLELAKVLDMQRGNDVDLQELVQKFIRIAKGSLPQSQQDNYTIGSGQDIQDKPEWCFHPYLLKDLVKVELKIYKILMRIYLDEQNEETPLLTALQSYLTDFEQSSLRAIRNVESANQGQSSQEDPYLYIASHPLLIYRLVRRFAKDLQPILRELEDQYEDLIMSLTEEVNPDLLIFPTTNDLRDALESISRMQSGNLLNTYEIARGVLVHLDTGIHMNALHSLEVGAFYLESDLYDVAIQWLHFAHEMVKKSVVAEVYPEIEEFFQNMLEEAVKLHNENFPAKLDYKWGSGVFNSTVVLPFEPAAYIMQTEQLKSLASLERNVTSWNWAIKQNFKRVCSGENLQSAAEIALLHCWYQTHHYYWLINPLKTELLSMNPRVYQFHDFFGDKLIESMKSSAVSQLKRSTVVDRESATKTKVDSTRTSTQTWLYDYQEDTKFLASFSRKLELLSGLIILPPSSSDAYQVASYGPSHHYEAHIDSFENPRRADEKGNRITTIMGYLSDVTVGGRTGFPVLGTAAEPLKGSLVMWDNLKRNGEERDLRTWHGGCPVVAGIKWITNKWVYYKDNAFTFQCTLDKNE